MKAVFLFLGIALATIAQAHTKLAPPHMDLEMTGAEYARLQAKQPQLYSMLEAGPMDAILAIGKRNLDWLIFINDHRPASEHLSFSNPDNMTATPIDQAKEYNEAIVLKQYQDLLKTLPASLKKVLEGSGSFPVNPNMAEKDYLQWGLAVNRVYENASRWLMMQPYLDWLSDRKHQDIRGYYFLQRENKLEAALQNFSTLPTETRAKYHGWLVGECFNSDTTEAACEQELQEAIAQAKVLEFHQKYLPNAQDVFQSFFAIVNWRSDALWSAQDPGFFHLPFLAPDRPDIQSFLSDNIQDEWRRPNWQLKLDFTHEGSDLVHMEFEPGATPHVNGLAGSTIVMDGNAPLTEYDVRWTIRHEFGHVLGFPDCYVEFYDQARGTIVSYQIDTTNLMCSRRGHLQDRHYDELKRVYMHRIIIQ